MLSIIALRNLIKAGRRSILLSVAVASVTMLVVMMLSLTEGIRTSVVRSATVLLSGHVNVAGFFKATPSDLEPVVLEAPTIKEIVAQNTPGVTSVVDRTQGFARIIGPTDTIQTLIMGVDIADETAFLDVIRLAPPSAYRPDFKDGNPNKIKGDASRLEEPNTALLFASQAERLGVDVGDPLTIRAETFSGVANTADVTVVAIAEDVGLLSTFAMFVPKETLRELYQLNDTTTGMIMAYLEDPEDARAALGEIRSALEAEGYELMDPQSQPYFAKFEQVRGEDWTGQKLDLTTWKDQISFLDLILTAINTVSLFIVTVLGVIIGVGMINTMLMAVRERTSEIGTMRAMGMSRRQILLLFMLEAMMLGFGAATFGAFLGAGVAVGVDAAQIHIPVDAVQAILLSDTLNLAVAPLQVLAAIAAITAFTGLAAFWPSLKAARMQPVDAIRHAE
jgi:putative ABC transport system permease protein